MQISARLIALRSLCQRGALESYIKIRENTLKQSDI